VVHGAEESTVMELWGGASADLAGRGTLSP